MVGGVGIQTSTLAWISGVTVVMGGEVNEDVLNRIEVVLQERVCSPVHRCFPPRPTICLICGYTSGTSCPFRETPEQS